MKAFEVGAIDYLLKPIELDRLAAALARLGGRAERGVMRLFVRDGARSWWVPMREVRLIASEGNYRRGVSAPGEAVPAAMNRVGKKVPVHGNIRPAPDCARVCEWQLEILA